MLEGPGGGSSVKGATDGGSGGGYIYVCAASLVLEGSISADGGLGSKQGAGGGSGGTIYLLVNFLFGSGSISSQGATGNSTEEDYFGSAGAGGRIKIYYLSWFNSSIYPNMTLDNALTYNVDGGNG